MFANSKSWGIVLLACYIKKEKKTAPTSQHDLIYHHIKNVIIYLWGEMWGSNPRMPEPQSGVLTTSPIPPCKTILTNY